MNQYLENNSLKFIFTIFQFDKNSGGNSIIPNMIKSINKLYSKPIIYYYILEGIEIKHDLDKNLPQTDLYMIKDKNLPQADLDMIKDKNNIAIYPEAVGNPLNFTKIVRFNFYFNIYEPNVENEYNIFFMKSYYELYNHVRSLYGISTNNNLISYNKFTNYFFNVNDVLDICKDYGNEREENCFIIRKGNFVPHIRNKLDYHPNNAIEILYEQTNVYESVKIFNRYKYFYSYDGFTFLLCIAALCGCIPIIVPFSGFTNIKQIHFDEYFVNGIAYGNSDDQILHAANTRGKVRESLIELKNHNFDDDFKEMISSIKTYFN